MGASTVTRSVFVLGLVACACSDTPLAPEDAGSPSVDAGPDRQTPSDASTPLEDSGLPPVPEDAGEPEPVGEIITARIGPISAAAGDEDTRCVQVRIDTPPGAELVGMRTRINPGSHHMVVYLSQRTSEQSTPVPCFPFSDILTGTQPLAIAQQPESELRYPSGTALTLQENQMIRLELHYFNYLGEHRDDIQGEVEFLLAPVDGQERDEVGLIFWGTTDISVPPHSEGSATSFHPVPLPTSTHPEPIHIFGLTSHTHQWGELAYIERATGPSGPAIETLHTSTSWEDPPLDTFSPPLTFEAGEGLRLTCEYFNGSDDTLRFGESFNEEMCFLWAYYYPSRGFLFSF